MDSAAESAVDEDSSCTPDVKTEILRDDNMCGSGCGSQDSGLKASELWGPWHWAAEYWDTSTGGLLGFEACHLI